jgi:hypothetical protein
MGNCATKTIKTIESIDLQDIKQIGEVLKKYYNVYDSLDEKSKQAYDEASNKLFDVARQAKQPNQP